MKGGLFRRAGLPRAWAEAGALALLLFLAFAPVMALTPPLPRSLYFALLGVAYSAWLGLRLRAFAGPWWLKLLQEAGLALAAAAALTGVIFGGLNLLGLMETIRVSYAGTGGTVFLLALSVVEVFGVRLAAAVWARWNRLRRQRYVWSLTHAILSVVGALGALALVGAVIYTAIRGRNDIWGIPPDSLFAQLVFWLSLLVIFFAAFAAVGVLVVFPPAFLFSYLVARWQVRRLETLAAATRALRAGQLSARAPVEGEDEIAQLEADFNDMAARIEATLRALQTEKDKVWALSEARRDLTAAVSHELRNPAAAIAGYSDALRRNWRTQDPAAVDRDLEVIQREAARLRTILNDLLTAAQAEAGRLSVHLKAIDAAELAGRVTQTLAPLAWESRRVTVHLTAPPRPVWALADPLRVEQALVNLVQNAVRHTSPGGLVALEARLAQGAVWIEVEDTGEGILPEDLPHIWERYYQSSDPQRRAESGAGLGLSLVKELAEAMGGEVSAESWPGQGSVFRLRLPAAAAGDCE